MVATESNCRRGCPDPETRKDSEAGFGEAVAGIAIDAMKEEAAPKSAAAAFIKKCESEEMDPISVVRRVAKRYGISVSSDIPPEDEPKRKVYHLLREVVRQVVVGIAEESDEDLKAFLNGFVRNDFKSVFFW